MLGRGGIDSTWRRDTDNCLEEEKAITLGTSVSIMGPSLGDNSMLLTLICTGVFDTVINGSFSGIDDVLGALVIVLIGATYFIDK